MSRPARALLACLLLGGCAQKNQTLKITAEPGIAVTVDDTPAVGVAGEIPLYRGSSHEVVLENSAGATEVHKIASVISPGKILFDTVGMPLVIGLLTLAGGSQDTGKVFGAGVAGGFLLYSLPALLHGMATGAYYSLSPLEITCRLPAAAVAGAAGLGRTAALDGRLTLAVMDLAPIGVPAGDAKVITEMIRTRFVEGDTFAVIEKSQIEKVLAEQAFQQTGCTTQDCAVKLGRILNAQVIALGTFSKFQGEFILNLRLVNVETAQVLISGTARGKDLAALEQDGEKLRTAIRARFLPQP